jgi:hypothetical protein
MIEIFTLQVGRERWQSESPLLPTACRGLPELRQVAHDRRATFRGNVRDKERFSI